MSQYLFYFTSFFCYIFFYLGFADSSLQHFFLLCTYGYDNPLHDQRRTDSRPACLQSHPIHPTIIKKCVCLFVVLFVLFWVLFGLGNGC